MDQRWRTKMRMTRKRNYASLLEGTEPLVE
jgi:hypothetical protein